MKERVEAAKQHFDEGAGGDIWGRLNAVDFMNQAFVLAALLLLCVIPFLMLFSAVKGADFVDNVSRHMGLNAAASQDVRTLFKSSSGTLAAVNALSVIGLLIWAVSAVAVIRGFYLKVFDVGPKGTGALWRVPVWFVVTAAAASLIVVVNGWLYDLWQGRVLVGVFDIALNLAFWWWTIHFLLAGRRTWRYLLPAAVATTLFWAGLRFFSSLFFSSAMTSNEDKYGPIGVVFIIMYWLIAVGVVILLGAVVGVVWQERRGAPRAASGL